VFGWRSHCCYSSLLQAAQLRAHPSIFEFASSSRIAPKGWIKVSAFFLRLFCLQASRASRSAGLRESRSSTRKSQGFFSLAPRMRWMPLDGWTHSRRVIGNSFYSNEISVDEVGWIYLSQWRVRFAFPNVRHWVEDCIE
jgi:hypothetical protein